MTSATDPAFTFYGRVDEQVRLRGLFNDLLEAPRERDTSWSQVAVIHGLGGIGKSTLLAQVGSWLHGNRADPRYRNQFTVVRIDWERERGLAKAQFPASSGPSPDTVIKVLRRVVADRLSDRHFRQFDDLGEREQKALAKLEASLGPQVAGNAGGAETGSRALPVLRAALTLGSLVSGGLPDGVSEEQVAQLAKVGIDEVRTLLTQAQHRMRTTLSAQERDLIADPMPTKAAGFAEALRSAAAKRPLVVLMDTYEIVRAVGPWLREIMARCGPRVGWVLAGRLEDAEPGLPGDLAEFVREVHPGGRLRVIKLSGFSLRESDAYLTGMVPGRPADKSELTTLYQATSGIPLAVGAAAARWREGEPMSAITAEQPANGRHTPLPNLLTTRFLTHTEQDGDPSGDRARLLTLSLVSTPEDMELVGRLWDVPDAEPMLRAVTARHDFVFTGTMLLHDVVRDQFRGFLRYPGNMSGTLHTANQRVIDLLERRLTDRNTRLPTLHDRLSDDRWTQTFSALAWHRFWGDFEAGWETVRAAFPAAMAYDHRLGTALLDDAEQFAVATTDHHRAELRALRTAISAHRPWSAADPDVFSILERKPLTDGVQGDHGTRGERTAIICWQKAKSLLDNGRVESALRAFQSAARGMSEEPGTLHRAVADDLIGLSELLVWRTGSGRATPSVPGLTAARLATRLAPENPETWRTLTIAEFAHHQYPRALKAIEQATDLDPDNARNHIDRAYLLSWHYNWNAMLEAARQSVQADPDDPDTHIVLSTALTIARRDSEALASAHRAVAADQHRASAHLQVARTLQHMLDLDGALTAATAAVTLEPDSPAAHIRRSSVLAGLMRPHDALAAAHDAVGCGPDDPDAHIQLSEVLSWHKEREAALRSAEKAVEVDPTYAKAHARHCYALTDLRRHAEAESAAVAAAESDPADVAGPIARGDCLLWTGDFASALAFYRQAGKMDPTMAQAVRSQAVAMVGLSRFDDALNTYRAAIRLAPEESGLHAWLGTALMSAGHFDDALASIDRAIELAQDDADCRQFRGDIMALRSGDPAAAVADYDRAAEVVTDPFEVSVCAGFAAWMRRDFERASALWLPELRRDPDNNLQIAVLAGVAATVCDDHDAAVDHFRTALRVERNPWSASTPFERAELRAIALSGLGRGEEALQLLADQSSTRRPGDRHELVALDLMVAHPRSAGWASPVRAAVLG
jgi:tetratricopeptide (TPR) repeat protein